jgi:hypothetical protein
MRGEGVCLDILKRGEKRSVDRLAATRTSQ